MKQCAKTFLSVLLLLSTAAAWSASERPCNDRSERSRDCGDDCDTRSRSRDCNEGCDFSEHSDAGCHGCQTSIFLPRPQGRDTAAFFNPFLYGSDMGDQCFTGWVGFRYQQTFKGHRIASCLFGSDVLHFQGSEVPERRTDALVADNFGLSPNFSGRVKFNPRIRDYMVDFAGRVDLGPWMECLEGAYFELNATAAHSNWDLRACAARETHTGGEKFDNFPAGAVASGEVTSLSDLRTALGAGVTFGQASEARRFGNFRFDSKSKTALANIDMILGYDFLLCDTYHLGAFIIGSAPTGNTPDPDFVFNPIVGNGHHWELGGGLTGHYEFWNCDDQSLGIFLNGHVEHLFKDTQKRSLDFRNTTESGCLSRYLLLKEFDTDNNFSGRLIPAINTTTRSVESSFKVQGDASLRFLYRACGWAAGVGYNVFGRSNEKLCLDRDCCDRENRNLGIKGTTGVSFFKDGKERSLVATQSEARITTVSDEVDNDKVIKHSKAWNGKVAHDSILDGENAPVYVTDADLDVNRAEIPSYITHKFFAHVDYQWEDCECKPWVGLGGEVEFAQKGKEHVCTANKWGVWVRTGVSF